MRPTAHAPHTATASDPPASDAEFSAGRLQAECVLCLRLPSRRPCDNMRPALLKPLASAAPAQLPPPPGGEDLKCYAVFFTKDPFHKKVS